ncbi:Cytochrome P450 family protein [Ceratobasidium theobromae]|uniref:Cytochrome P450 family protein n=1 Tax=Ceratobasidium theobromae TaxID=1582974 RepID=A0A5N5QDQ5_9AGAM|nr:Cytochrome P450 family protein [Ceratobasidium theobromae]
MEESRLNLALGVALVATAAAAWNYANTSQRRYPPSPKSDPFIGHLRVLPQSNEHLVYRQMARELKSDVIMLKVPGQSFIILNSARATADLFDKRSKSYSGRPFIPMVMDPSLVDWSRHIGFLPYGERWKRQRQLMNVSFRKGAVHKYWPVQTRYARQAALWILEKPEDFVTALTRMSGATILSCVYGYEVTKPDDELIRAIERAADHLGRAVLPSNFLVNIMPWLNYLPSWLPGMGWRKVVNEWREELRGTIEIPYAYTVQQMAAGTAPPSALNDMLRDAQSVSEKISPEEEDRIMWTAGSLFTAATDSLYPRAYNQTLSTLQVFVLAMTLNQPVQAKIRDEIERVTGGKRLPELSDMEHMPYVRCVMLEVLRWQPVAPIGLPHTCKQDDEYNGYTIPKGSLVIGNIWGINHDESVYDDPESFIPERFMSLSTPEPVSFGFGRRLCPGMHFAHGTLFINMVTLIAVFNIRPIRDENGNEVLPKVEMVQHTLVTNPAPFKCEITPRSEAHKQVLLDVTVNC